MTSDTVLARLVEDEGCVLHAYTDSLGYWTIGIGTLIDRRKGGGITREEAEYLAENRIGRARLQLDAVLPWWRTLDDVRQDVLLDMGFNLGVDGLQEFHATLGAVKAGRWRDAANGMRASLWYQQVGNRAERLAREMETGTRVARWW